MKKSILSVLSVLFLKCSLNAALISISSPVWQTLYQGVSGLDDVSNSVIVDTSNSNIYVTGYEMTRSSPLYTRGFIAEYSSTGSIVWSSTFGVANSRNEGKGIAIDTNGFVYVAGVSTASAFISKYSSTGTLQSTTYFFLVASSVSVSSETVFNTISFSSGYIYSAGYAVFGSTDYRAIVVKYDSSFNVIWQSSYTSHGINNALSIAEDMNTVFTCGTSSGMEWVGEFSVTSGTLKNALFYGGNGLNPDVCYGLTLDSSSAIYMTGYQETVVQQTQAQTRNIHVQKIGNDNLLRWTTYYVIPNKLTIGAGGTDTGKSSIIISSYVYVAGIINSTSTKQDIFINTYDDAGVFIASTTYNYYFSPVTQTGGRDFATSLTPGGTDFFLVGAISQTTTTVFGLTVSTNTIPRGTDGVLQKY